MNKEKVINHICNWLTEYASQAKSNGFVLGVSGGIDSALTSTLAAKTGLPTLCLEMPIHQQKDQVKRGKEHLLWLKSIFKNVSISELELTSVFNAFTKQLPKEKIENELALANSRARLRMTTLYYFAQINNYLVVGTGNKVEDFGIGFFTKYGDGGVDISPIADLLKSEVYELAAFLKLNQNILDAAPTDGLWGDNKTDEEQIGASYTELEWAMQFTGNIKELNTRESEVLSIFQRLNQNNQHKIKAIPVCKIPNRFR